ncbi:glycosyltransferase family 4 protein [Tautonia sociabilis]|uniref:Glycosyltransferase n=1 Tax=Tautonia sociabilis TaxID=2080755 RepID=A0A432ML36_9BACT|nr:glycosyltransferase family 4 protein [Tautonia sociabilis]RUL87846.1 glycosyltransferase [Tautonia sociabilis]
MAIEFESVALYYDADGYVEPKPARESAGRPRAPGTPAGLMGRHVAGKGFLDGLFDSGSWRRLVAVVPDAPSAQSIRSYWEEKLGGTSDPRSLEVVDLPSLRGRFLEAPPARVLHFPVPPSPTFAWARQRTGPASFSITGVTHTLASLNGVTALGSLVTAPFEEHDALICTSEAVARMVRSVTGTYCDSLRDRFGGQPRMIPRLETIPLGVDSEEFRPATPAERAQMRQRLGIADDEVVFLFVGRLSFHAKANPYPMYRALSRASRETGRRVHLLLSGWAANEMILRAFHDGARVFAPNLRITIVDGTDPEYRRPVWDAADVFTSLSDNIQETFGLSITEAMACGLPVVASDWDGYRDQVIDGETGYLVPTAMVRDALSEASFRLILGEVNYDHFLCECSQAVVVDENAAASAFARLIADEEHRHQLGRAGRERATRRFSWARIVSEYESLWRELDERRREAEASRGGRPDPSTTPACYPPVEVAFDGYPTTFLGDDHEVIADEDAVERLDWLLKLPLTNYAVGRRSADPSALRAALRAAEAPCLLSAILLELERAGVEEPKRRPTIAWMIKYGLLAHVPAQDSPEPGEGRLVGANNGRA